MFSRHVHVPNRPKLLERLPHVIQRQRIVEIVNLDARQVGHIGRGFARTSVVARGVARPPCVDVDVGVGVAFAFAFAFAVHPIVVHGVRECRVDAVVVPSHPSALAPPDVSHMVVVKPYVYYSDFT